MMTQELTAESVSRRARDRRNGFSLLETLIVVSIGMILLAFSVPMVQSALRSYTFNSATSNLSRMVQQARYSAISQGTDVCTVLAGNQFGIDPDCDGALASTDTRIQLPVGVTVDQTSTISTATMPFPAAPTTFSCATFVVTFNSRGSKTSACGTASGVAATHVLFMTAWGGTNAVTVTGTGRARSWRWDGSAWQ